MVSSKTDDILSDERIILRIYSCYVLKKGSSRAIVVNLSEANLF